MNKKLLSLAIATAFAAPLAQASEMTIYGRGHVALSSYDVSAVNNNTASAGLDYSDLSSHQSRLGVKGSEDLGNGLKAIYKMEFQVRMTDDGTDSTGIGDGDAGSILMRNQYVGLAGDWGTFLMGRHDTPLKISTGALDLFDGTVADYNGNGADGTEAKTAQGLAFFDVRADNAIAYVSPNMNGFTLAGAIVTPGETEVATATNNTADGLAEAYSIAAMYSNGPFYASLATENYSSEIVNGGTANDLAMWRAGLGYTANNFHAGFVYENQDVGGLAGETDIWQLSGSYTFGNNVVKASYGEQDNNAANGDLTQWAVGVDHMFSKKTKVYVVYTDVDAGTGHVGTQVSNGLATANGGSTDWSGLSGGLVIDF